MSALDKLAALGHKLEAVALSKSYKRRRVIKSVAMDINSGEIVGLLGPNGAGKTTCFYMLIGLLKPDSGQVLLDGSDISRYSMAKRARLGIGYLPQDSSVFGDLSVRNNVLAVLELQPGYSRSQRQQKADELLFEFGLEHLSKTKGAALSGGERRRVETARALASNPNFLMLDEPFAGVDPISVDSIKNTIQKLQQRGIGVLITDHNVRETLQICNRIYIVGEGEIIASGSREEVLANARVRSSYLGQDFELNH